MFSFIFGGDTNASQSAKKKKKDKNIKNDAKLNLNPLKSVTMSFDILKGYGPKKTECQDSMCAIDKQNQIAEDVYFLAVYDGHGSSGKEASQAANDYIQTYLEKNSKKIAMFKDHKERENLLQAAFQNAESKLKSSGIDYTNSGTCAIAVFIQKQFAYVANLGDSRCVCFRVTPKDSLAIQLSYDHQPTRPDEQERILKSGGQIERLMHEGVPVGPYRVWADDEGPGIAMTRTLGDLQAKKIGLISEPEIQRFELTRQDQFMVIGSDGLWDVMNSAEVVGFVNYHLAQGVQREDMGKQIVKEARSRWDEMNQSQKINSQISDVPSVQVGCDDITAVIAFLDFQDEKAD